MTGVPQLEQNRQVDSVEGVDALILNQSQPQVAVQHPFWGDVSSPSRARQRRSEMRSSALSVNRQNGRQPKPDCPLIVALWTSRTRTVGTQCSGLITGTSMVAPILPR